MSGWLLTLAPLGGLGIDVLVQIAVARRSGRVGRSIVAGACAGFVAVVAIALPQLRGMSFADLVGASILAAATYAALAFGFWTFLNLNITSLRIRMLREIVNSGGGISKGRLFERYSSEEFLQRRLERLQAAGQLRHAAGRWWVDKPTYLQLARTIDAVRTIVLPSAQRGG